MNQTPLRRAHALSAFCVLAVAMCGHVWAAAPPRPLVKQAPWPVGALLYSTMPSSASHGPEMAMDGDPGSYFQTAYGMDDGDDFLVRLSQPIPVRSIHITTGDADGQDLLTNAFVETSPDGMLFHKVAAFDNAGVADAALPNAPVAALRIRLNHGTGIPSLVIREITLSSSVEITHVMRGPGRGFYDLKQAHDLKTWAHRAELQMEAVLARYGSLAVLRQIHPAQHGQCRLSHRAGRHRRRRYGRRRHGGQLCLVPRPSRRHRPDGSRDRACHSGIFGLQPGLAG